MPEDEAELDMSIGQLAMMAGQCKLYQSLNEALADAVEKLKEDLSKHPLEDDSFNLDDVLCINRANEDLSNSRELGFVDPLTVVIQAKDTLISALQVTVADRE